MIPNKTEEQILYQQFKFYDLDSSGFCTLQNFIKANDRLGVVLPKLENFEIIFNYFSDPETSLLNYRKFIREIFNFKSSDIKANLDSEKKEEIPENNFIDILTDKIIERGGTFALIELVKNLQMVDFEGNKRMNIDNFIKALQRCKIFLNTNEMESLFNDYNIFENGIVKYQIIINIILEQFWDDEKLSLSEEIYYLLTGNGRRNASLNVLKNYFDQILADSLDKKFFIEFINEYKTINKINISQTMILKELVEFLKYYNFGRQSNKYLIDLINILKDQEEADIIKRSDKNKESGFKKLKQNKKEAELEGKKINNFLGEGYENPKMNEINAKLREKLIKFGRKTLFNFLKHFKFYDNKTKYITKYDFSKIFKNFNIKISIDDIDEIFKNYGIDKLHSSMNYELYLNDLILGYTPKERQAVINYIYDTILERGESLERDIDITFLKQMYNENNNYFIKDRNENRIDFEECLELYHYSYNGLKTDKVSKKEFCFFYYFISLLVSSDADFYFMITNEWRVPLDNLNNIISKGNTLDMLKFADKGVRRNLSNMSRIAQLGENTKDYQGNMNSNDNNNYEQDKDKYDSNIDNTENDNIKYPLNRKDFEDQYSPDKNMNINKNKNKYDKGKDESLSLLTNKLLKRGLRGILYLYSQFLSFCPNVNKITYNDFCLVFKIQHIDLDTNTLHNIFDLYSSKNNNEKESYLDFYSFIRTYKKELNENKLNAVEKAFSLIDKKGEDKVPLDVIKMKYSAKKHPDVLNGKYTEDEKIMEFLDCFQMCYEILKMDNREQRDENGEFVDFEIFANFYEYVSFIFPKDKDFQYVISSTWN